MIKKWLLVLFMGNLLFVTSCKDDEKELCECLGATIEFLGPDTSRKEIIIIYNALTPNNDRTNDLFCIYARGVAAFELKIKDGTEIIFQTDNRFDCWNGLVNGELYDCRNFDYEVYVTFGSGFTKSFKGLVTSFKSPPCPKNLSNCIFSNQVDPYLEKIDYNKESGEMGC